MVRWIHAMQRRRKDFLIVEVGAQFLIKLICSTGHTKWKWLRLKTWRRGHVPPYFLCSPTCELHLPCLECGGTWTHQHLWQQLRKKTTLLNCPLILASYSRLQEHYLHILVRLNFFALNTRLPPVLIIRRYAMGGAYSCYIFWGRCTRNVCSINITPENSPTQLAQCFC